MASCRRKAGGVVQDQTEDTMRDKKDPYRKLFAAIRDTDQGWAIGQGGAIRHKYLKYQDGQCLHNCCPMCAPFYYGADEDEIGTTNESFQEFKSAYELTSAEVHDFATCADIKDVASPESKKLRARILEACGLKETP